MSVRISSPTKADGRGTVEVGKCTLCQQISVLFTS